VTPAQGRHYDTPF